MTTLQTREDLANAFANDAAIACNGAFKEAFNSYYVAVAELETARTGDEEDEQAAFRALLQQEKTAEAVLFAVIDAHCAKQVAIALNPGILR